MFQGHFMGSENLKLQGIYGIIRLPSKQNAEFGLEKGDTNEDIEQSHFEQNRKLYPRISKRKRTVPKLQKHNARSQYEFVKSRSALCDRA